MCCVCRERLFCISLLQASFTSCSHSCQEEEAIGDVDLFTVSEDGKELTVNAKWLQHLQERLLGEDGHPRKVRLAVASIATLTRLALRIWTDLHYPAISRCQSVNT